MGLVIWKGEPLSLSYGIFASYHRCGPFKALRDFDLLEAIEVYKSQTSEATDEYSLLSDFPDYLIAHRYIELTPCRNIYLGEFNGFDVREVFDPDE
ncbi:hypothetical protein [Pseudomonas fluorescens]|uniref:Uncharacterized protein n=1 Tax=Pseudomonas fluorescens TaxID=294 RepID=A0A5E7RAJ3_PSEFL|nr:hypothetical protein [Pseudomonas fluorescens]VVP71532.1 hypothetical protein PS922_00882 [Pseudomonas fluorescens]